MTPDRLDDAQRSLYDSIVSGRRSQGPTLFRIVAGDGALEGPFEAFLANPEIGARLSVLGEGLRYHGSLSDVVREVVILSVARDRDCEYEWYAHSAVARHLGLSDAVLDKLRDGDDSAELPENVATALELYRCIRSWDGIPDDVYSRAVETFGTTGITEIACVIFYYDTLAALLSIFDIDLPEGVSPRLCTRRDG